MVVVQESDNKQTASVDVELRGKICAAILTAKKNAALYPDDHPVLQRSMDAIRELLAAHVETTGASFTLRIDVEEDPESDQAPGTPQASVLRSLLRRYLIRQVDLEPAATSRELFEFCYLLREDLFKKQSREDALPFDPAQWKGIRLQFYSPDVLASRRAVANSLLEAAAGVHDARGIGAWLDALPEDVRRDAETELARPSILTDISNIRRKLQEATAERSGAEGDCDLVGRVLLAAVPPGGSSDAETLVARAIRTLKSFTEFLQENSCMLRDGVELGDDGELKNVLGDFAKTAAGRPSVLAEIEKLRGEKEGFGALFESAASGALGGPSPGSGSRTATRSASGTDNGGGQAKAANAEASARAMQGGREEPRADADPLKGGFRKVKYDLKELEGALRDAATAGNYLGTVLEVLQDEEGKKKVRANWRDVVVQVGAAGGGGQDARERVRLVSESMSRAPLAEGEELISSILSALESPQDIVELLEEFVGAQAGKQAVRRVLDAITKESRKRALEILLEASRSREDAVRAAAGAALLDLAAKPEALADWALADPACLSRPGVGNAIQKTPARRLRASFQDVFATASPEHSTALLRGATAGAEGMAQLLLAAVLGGPPGVRRLAISMLPEYPTPEVARVLQGIVEASNSGLLRLREVEAALEALRSMDDPAVRAFLDRVVHERHWFRYKYRKEIRDLLLGKGSSTRGL